MPAGSRAGCFAFVDGTRNGERLNVRPVIGCSWVSTTASRLATASTRWRSRKARAGIEQQGVVADWTGTLAAPPAAGKLPSQPRTVKVRTASGPATVAMGPIVSAPLRLRSR